MQEKKKNGMLIFQVCGQQRKNDKMICEYIPQPHESAFLDPLLLQVYPQAQEYECKH